MSNHEKLATYAGQIVISAEDVYAMLDTEDKERFNRVIIADVSRDIEMNVVLTFVAVNDVPKIVEGKNDD